MPTYRLDFSYDGADFHGYAKQPSVTTVQMSLEGALFKHTGPVATAVAGRTDKGVHARAQVVSFAVDADLDTNRVVRSMNRQLAPQVSVHQLREVPAGFSARFDATGRAYTYIILNRSNPDPFLARTTWFRDHELDLTAMNRAAAAFIGERDFASLCRKAEGRSTVRDVRSASWNARGHGLMFFDVTASSFCHQMVRSMVQLCFDVGRGRIATDAVAGILDAQDRHAGRGVAPAHGLALVRVEYPAELGGPADNPYHWP